MTHAERTDLERRYQVDDNGRVAAPGPFLGFYLYVAAFWLDAERCGQIPDEGHHVLTFVVTAEDRHTFPELEGKDKVGLLVRAGQFQGEA